jgi:hypothetical protein
VLQTKYCELLCKHLSVGILSIVNWFIYDTKRASNKLIELALCSFFKLPNDWDSDHVDDILLSLSKNSCVVMYNYIA